MTKHEGFTPGPWEIKGYSVFMGNGPNASGANLTKFGALGETEFWANARLIAAAPALHEALKNLVQTFIDGSHYQTQNPYTRPQVVAALAALGVDWRKP